MERVREQDRRDNKGTGNTERGDSQGETITERVKRGPLSFFSHPRPRVLQATGRNETTRAPPKLQVLTPPYSGTQNLLGRGGQTQAATAAHPSYRRRFYHVRSREVFVRVLYVFVVISVVSSCVSAIICNLFFVVLMLFIYLFISFRVLGFLLIHFS